MLPLDREIRVAVGGTFEAMHPGHIAILKKAFELGDEVVIGLTSDEFVKKMGKKLELSYIERLYRLKGLIDEISCNKRFWITMLNDQFGPVLTEDFDFIVVSPETFRSALVANQLRAERGLKPMSIFVIHLVLAENGTKISSARIKLGEMTSQGKIVKTAVQAPEV